MKISASFFFPIKRGEQKLNTVANQKATLHRHPSSPINKTEQTKKGIKGREVMDKERTI